MVQETNHDVVVPLIRKFDQVACSPNHASVAVVSFTVTHVDVIQVNDTVEPVGQVASIFAVYELEFDELNNQSEQ